MSKTTYKKPFIGKQTVVKGSQGLTQVNTYQGEVLGWMCVNVNPNEVNSELTRQRKALSNNSNLIKLHIIDSIQSEGYNVQEPRTNKAKLQFLHNTFKLEFGDWHISATKSYDKSLSEWIAGLPSAFDIEYINDDIIKLGIKFGALTDQSTDTQCSKYINNWFHMIATKTTQLLRCEGIIK